MEASQNVAVTIVDERSGLTFKRLKNKRDEEDIQTFQPLYATPKTPVDGRQLPSMRHSLSFLRSSSPPHTPGQEEDYGDDDDDSSSIYQDQQSYLRSPRSPETMSTRSYMPLLKTPKEPHISPNEFYKHIPTHLDDTARLKQLIYWAAQDELQKESKTRNIGLNRESNTAKKIARQMKDKFLESFADGEIPVYWVTTNPTTEVKKRPNSKNIKNLEKIKNLENAIEDLKREEEEWKKATRDAFMFHALSVKSNASEKGKGLEFGNNYLKELEEDQIAVVEEALEPVEDVQTTRDITDVHFRASHTCQMLSTTHEFQTRASQFVDKIHSFVGKRLNEMTKRLDYEDKSIPRLFDDSESKRNEIRNEIAHKLLLAIIKQKEQGEKQNEILASEAAANDLAEIRKLIEGMNALINSQLQQQQQQQQQQTQQVQTASKNTIQPTEKQESTASIENTTNVQSPFASNSCSVPVVHKNEQLPPQQLGTHPDPAQIHTVEPSNPNGVTPVQQTPATNAQLYSHATPEFPPTGVITEVAHLISNRTLYFQLAQDATIDPLIGWLRLSFQDPYISGMVLQYKGLDGLWKCLLNRDDSLRRVIKQSLKSNVMLQMRVPREEDLLSSGYTDRRLLALTKPNSA
ncbi:hypothetical protein G6F55_000427 [Rhizopus delemar]|uniref:Uncharacterized protein n=3 Tax=Rhizopus TaxID=4842 RepID=I1CM93_RHIO9|nr:hypothetical protein RO3G_14284 [Rhizopus delemar RA 99-880]KAG1466512.1 hypothetical protein G6F55_000427 [Rhizopus delemar]KAG1552636.1 hypothetical protein G6F51_001103 [Rhizopus arrhizus]KAG1504533.1 hypothetical protein G6F54_000942 [Rhizopus delemar]KAG1518234.1 hypothetical protein G6F53_000740 [Rhizopus delemar]|eukprot:EIE89573.1 hypothetical protein RO3G_14284 [Rhizopus delemar RA 99-880]